MAVYTKVSEDGSLRRMKMAASTTIVENTFVTLSSGYLVPATATTDELKYIARESKISAAATFPSILVEALTDGADIVVDTAGNTSQSLIGTKIDLTDAATANQAASAKKVLEVRAIEGATTDKKLVVRIVPVDKTA